MPFITQGKTNFKYILIVIILAVVADGGILVYYYLWIAGLEVKLAELELKLPAKVEDETAKLVPSEVEGWKSYRSGKYNFEFKYPSEWIVEEINGEPKLRDEEGIVIISINSVDPRLLGISYCGAYPQDIPRCEQIKVRDIPVTIDWEVDGKANALFTITNGFGLSITLHQVDPEIRDLFRQFLSTFKFIEDETANWKTYKNEEYGFEFQYPPNWGDIQLVSQRGAGYVFNSQNENVEEILYHKSSKMLAFIIKEKKFDCGKAGSTWPLYEWNVRLISSSREIKNIYSFQVDETYCAFYPGLENINFSPNGKYLYFILTGWETTIPLFIDVETKKDILEQQKDIWFFNPSEDVFWSPNNKVLAIRSYTNDLAGEGIDGLFVSEYDNIKKLNQVFAFSSEQHFSGSKIYGISFVNNEVLIFSVLLKECMGNGEWKCFEEIIKYEYNTKTKELKEIK